MDVKVYQMGGLDEKSGHLIRKDESATRLVNLQLDGNGYWEKRGGSSLYSDYTASGVTDLSTLGAKMVYSQSLNEKLILGPVMQDGNQAARVLSNGTLQSIPAPTYISSTNLGFRLGKDTSVADNNGCIYFTNKQLSGKLPTPVLKYDGGAIYAAGMPSVTDAAMGTYTETRSTTTQRQCAYQYGFIDAQGNMTFGPLRYVFKEPAAAEVRDFISPTIFGHYVGGLTTTGALSLTSVNRTIPVANLSGSTTYDSVRVGDFVLIESPYHNSDSFGGLVINNVGVTVVTTSGVKKPLVALRVESISNVSGITFTADSFDGITSVDLAINAVLNIRHFLIQWRDITNSSVFYLKTVGWSVFSAKSPYTALTNSGGSIADASVETKMEDVIDPLESHLMPPICDTLSSFGDQLVFGSVRFTIDFKTNLIPYNNDDLLMYSDGGIGATCENISLLNRQRIGETFEGSIVGAARVGDSLAVLKTNSVHIIDGLLFQGEYSIRKINTLGIGCSSEDSILSFDGSQVLFAAIDGIYATDGVKVLKISSQIETSYGTDDIEKTTVIAVQDKVNGRAIFVARDTVGNACKIFTYDAEYQQWTTWTGIDGRNGAIYANDDYVYLYRNSGTSNKILKLDKSLLQDQGVNIDAYYSTNWLHMGNAAVAKKFEAIRLFCFSNTSATISVLVEKNWVDAGIGSAESAGSLAFTSSAQTKHLRFDQKNVRSLRVTFRNSSNEDIKLSGWQLEAQPWQERDKGD